MTSMAAVPAEGKGKGDERRRKFEVLDHQSIELSRLHPNPRNPRPTFHFGQDNPEIIALGESIRIDGLHNPLKVYELMPEAPGEFRIVQGHRRYAGSQVSGVTELDCIIIRRPTDEKEELEWLGSEDAHKRAWSESGLFQMHHAYELAIQLGLRTPAHPEVAAKTGLTMTQLTVAEKIFKLEKPIQAMIMEYERIRYEQSLNGEAKRGRLSGSGVRTSEFPPDRAALVWDLFEALREHCTLTVQKLDDLDLQTKIARWSTQRGGVEGLKNLTQAVRQAGRNPRPGLLAQIDDLLNNDKRQVKDVVRTTRNTHIVRLVKLRKQLQATDEAIIRITPNTDSVGADLDLLKDTDRALSHLLRHADELQRRIEKLIIKEERR